MRAGTTFALQLRTCPQTRNIHGQLDHESPLPKDPFRMQGPDHSSMLLGRRHHSAFTYTPEKTRLIESIIPVWIQTRIPDAAPPHPKPLF